MLKIYNKQALTRNERFIRAVGYGVGATVGLTILYGLLARFLMFEFSVVTWRSVMRSARSSVNMGVECRCGFPFWRRCWPWFASYSAI